MAESGQVVGRISIKVLPDTSEFKSEARRELKKIQAEIKELKVSLELDKPAMDKLKKQLKDWVKNLSPLKVLVTAELRTGSLAAVNERLRVATRPREVQIIPKLNNAALANVAASLAALSGARAVANIFEKIGNKIKNLDKSVPIIGSIALAVAGIASWGITAVSNLAALSVTLAQIGAAGLALPGILGGVAIGLGVIVAGLKDFNQVMPGVKTQLSQLQDIISANFWDGFKGPLQSFIDSLLPQFTRGLAATATQMGGLFGSIATQLQGALDGSLAGMFADLALSINIAKDGATGLALAVKILGETGAGYLPRLSQWVVDIANRFAAWLTRVSASGELNQWINMGIQALKDLGSVASSVTRIISGIGNAALAGGGSSLTMFAVTLERIANAVNSPAFQTGLTQVFAAAHQAMSNLANGAGQGVLDLFTQLAESAQTILPLVGTTLGTLIGSIASALAQPAFQDGLKSFFQGMSEGVQGLLPAMAPLGTALGSLGEVLGTFAATLGPLLAQAFGLLADAVIKLSPAIQQVTPQMATLVSGLLTSLAPVIDAAVSALTAILPVLGQLAVWLAPLSPAILAVVVAWKAWTTAMAIGDWVTALSTSQNAVLAWVGKQLISLGQLVGAWIAAQAKVVAGLIAQTAAFIAEGAKQAAAMAVTAAKVVAGWVLMAVQSLAQAARMAAAWLIAMGPIGIVIAAVVALVALIVLNWDKIKEYTVRIWNAIVDWLKGAWRWIQEVVANGIASVLGFIGRLGNIASTVRGYFEEMRNAVIMKVAQVISFARGIPGQIMAAIGNLGSLLINAGRNLIQGLVDGIGSMIGAVKSKLGELTSLIPDWKGPASRDRKLLTNAGKLVMDGFIAGLESRYSAVKRSLGGLTKDMSGVEFAIPGVTGSVSARMAASASAASSGAQKVFNYYAAAGSSLGSQEDLFLATQRARMVDW